MIQITATYENRDLAHCAAVKIKEKTTDKTDTRIIPLSKDTDPHLHFPYEKYTLLTTGMINNTNVFITDPVITEITELDVPEMLLDETAQLSVFCEKNDEKTVSDILTATGGENVHIF